MPSKEFVAIKDDAARKKLFAASARLSALVGRERDASPPMQTHRDDDFKAALDREALADALEAVAELLSPTAKKASTK